MCSRPRLSWLGLAGEYERGDERGERGHQGYEVRPSVRAVRVPRMTAYGDMTHGVISRQWQQTAVACHRAGSHGNNPVEPNQGGR
jgi:hypothetical protein